MDTPVPRSRIARSGLALALLCALAPSVLRAQDTLFVASQESGSLVPDLRGRTLHEVSSLLAESRLNLGRRAEEAAAGVPGTVSRQVPAPGTRVPPGSSIAVWTVSARVAEMPAIMGVPPARAVELLREAGLRQGTVSGSEIQGPVVVIGHTYRAGERVRRGAVVNLAFGLETSRPVAVRADTPAARPAQTAQAAPAARRDPPAARPNPPVAARPDPPAARVDTPAVVVARVDSIAVPDVRALRLPDARAALELAGMAVVIDSVFVDSLGWVVATQAPQAGARVPAGSPVQLALAAPAPPPVDVVVPPPVASALQPAPAAAPPPPPARTSPLRWWIAVAVVVVVAAGAGAQRMMRRGAAPPVTGVRVGLRMDGEPRSSVQGPPLGMPRLKLRLSGGMPRARVAAESPLFRAKGGAG